MQGVNDQAAQTAALVKRITALERAASRPSGATGGGTPTGVIIMWGGDYLGTPPDGYSLCNGQTLSRTTYADLFAVIGTTYGAGDGSTTFAVPNLQGKFPIGENATYPANSTGGGSKDAIAVTHGHTDSGHTHSDSGHGHSDSGHAHTTTDTYRSNTSVVAAGSNYGYSPNLTTTYPSSYTGYASISTGYASISSGTANISSGTANIANGGSSGTDANMPPYIAVNFIIRNGL